MSWLSDFLGLKKVKTPAVSEPEELDYEMETDNYTKMLARRSGFSKQIIAGRKTPKLALGSILG